MKRKRENTPPEVYPLVASVLGQVGCMLTVTIALSIILGLVLDRILGTDRLFLLVLMLVSIPINIMFILWYTRRKTRLIQDSSEKEDNISEI